MEKESHQLIGKTILILSALLFSVVLIMTLLTLLSYGENSLEPSQSGDANESRNESTDSPEKRSLSGFRLLNENNLMKEDKKLNDFLDSLNSLLVQESNIDHPGEPNSSDSPSNQSSQSNLDQDWQRNSLNVGDMLALRRTQPEGDYETMPADYAVDPKSYRLPTRQGEDNIYSDLGYYDQYLNDGKTENNVEIYDNQNANYPDSTYSGGQVQYYLIRKEHNQVNLASQHEVRGLNELINSALSKQNSRYHPPIQYPPVHVKSSPSQPNIFVFPSSGQPATIIQPSNIVQQQPSAQYPQPVRDYYPHTENFWGWAWPKKPFKKLTMKQKFKINMCDRMMRKVSPYQLRMPLPFYR